MIRSRAVAFLLCAFCTTPASAEVTLTAPQVRAAALSALDQGAVDDAWILAQALLGRDPGDPVALSIMARITLAYGDMEGARTAAAGIWRNSSDDGERHQAARLVAWSHMQDDHLTRSRFWLRRALSVAPDESARAQTLADMRTLRDGDPLSFGFSLGVSPSNNVTGGSDVDVIEVNGVPVTLGPFPLSPTAIDQAWSGIAVTPSAHIAYRLHENPSSRTTLRASVQGRRVILSREARDGLEGETYDGEQITGRYFSSAQAIVGLSHERAAGSGNLTLSLDFGRLWQRGEHAADLALFGLSHVRPLTTDSALNLGFGVEYRRDAANSASDALRTTVRGGYMTRLDNGWQIQADLSLGHSASDDYRAAFNRAMLALAATPPAFLPGIEASTRVSATFTNYPDYRLLTPVPGGRDDRRLALGLDLSFTDLEWMGFTPQMQLEAHDTTSNVNQFELRGLDLGFSVRSVF